jgi:hypothetical protein
VGFSLSTSEFNRLRATKGRLAQSYPGDHPRIQEIDKRLAELRAEGHVRKALAEDLSGDAIERLAAMIKSAS